MSGKAKARGGQREHPLVHMKVPLYLRQYLVHLPEAVVASQSVVIAPAEWLRLFYDSVHSIPDREGRQVESSAERVRSG